MLREVNLFRSNPSEYAEKIRSHKQFIKLVKEKLAYENGEAKQSLVKGEEAFESCIQIIQEKSSLPDLVLSDDITLEIPDDVETQIQAFSTLLKELKAKNKGSQVEGNIDINHFNAEAITVLQLVDDTKTNGKRRNNLMNENFKKIGISIKKAKSKYMIYLTFSN